MTGWFGAPPEPGAPVLPPITVLGYDGSPLSPEGVHAVATADLVLGGQRHLDAARPTCRTIVLGPVEPALDELHAAHERGERVVVLASGDPGFFGIVRRLRAGRLPVTVLPAVSSVAAAFGRLGAPWDDALVVSAHGRPLAPALNVWRRFHRTPQRVAILTDVENSPAAIIAGLGEEFEGCEVLELLGEPGERHVTVLDQEPAEEVDDPDVIGPAQALIRTWAVPNVVVSPGGITLPEPSWLLGQRARLVTDQPGWALPDDAFAHRDNMVTKAEVRALALARLGPRVGDLVWDVGAGSGSVGIECARLGAAVIAVERDAVEHLQANIETFGVEVQVVQADAPAALEDLPDPDAVFVGGGASDVGAIVRLAVARGPRVVVVALAALDRVVEVQRALAPYTVDGVQLQASRFRALGEATGLAATNPVLLLWGTRP